MVKIAARLITTVATVIPERAGLRRRLSDARRASTASIPGSRSFERQNQPTANRINAGQKAARPRRKINMPMTPTLNRLTGVFQRAYAHRLPGRKKRRQERHGNAGAERKRQLVNSKITRNQIDQRKQI